MNMKTYISVGVVTNTLIVLRNAKRLDCYLISALSRIVKNYVDFEMTEDFAVQCGWIEIADQELRFTKAGDIIVKEFDGNVIGEHLWRMILKDYISNSKPAWARRIPAGRKEAFLCMSDETKRCFIESGLMSTPPDSTVVTWWDEIANSARAEINTQLNDTGRVGEMLTIEYELKRTGIQPIWQSIETNLVGYDLISRKDKNDAGEILIEVKASACNLEYAEMTISRNEWNVASCNYNYNRYYFYLWCLNEDKLLAKIPVPEIRKHIPAESGDGKWSSINIPFTTFKAKFVSIP